MLNQFYRARLESRREDLWMRSGWGSKHLVTTQTTAENHLEGPFFLCKLKRMAGTTRLELATSAVTGQRSNQLNYVPTFLYGMPDWWAVQRSNLRPPACKAGALTN